MAMPGRQLAFEIARPEEVLAIMEAAQPVKQAFHVSDVDYHLPPEQTAPTPFDIEAAFAPYIPPPDETELAQKSVSLLSDSYHKLAVEGEQLDAAMGELAVDHDEQVSRADQNEEEFYQQIRMRLLEGKTLEEVYRDMLTEQSQGEENSASYGAVRTMLQRVMDRLKAENLIDREEDLPQQHAQSHGVQVAGVETKVACHYMNEAINAEWKVEVIKQAIYDLQEKKAALRLPRMPSIGRTPKLNTVGSAKSMAPMKVKTPKPVATMD